MYAKLIELNIQNFKGIKSLGFRFDGRSAELTGENGVFKTTVYDALLWTLFNKDSTGRTDFEVRPLDKSGNTIEGVVTSVEVKLEIDGVIKSFRKEIHEQHVKGQLRGYTTLCWINEVPKRVSEYEEDIDELVDSDKFKMLADLRHFNSLHWKVRRQKLLELTGDTIDKPTGFSELLNHCKLFGRTIDEHQKVLIEQKKRHEKERAEINPRIDEIMRAIPSLGNKDVSEDLESRADLLAYLEDAKRRKRVLESKVHHRLKLLEELAELKSQRSQREAELKGVLSCVNPEQQKEMQSINDSINELVKKQQLIGREVNLYNKTCESLINDVAILRNKLSSVRNEYLAMSKDKEPDTCYACGSKLSQSKIEELSKKRTLGLQVLVRQGNELKAEVTEKDGKVAELKIKIAEHVEYMQTLDNECRKLYEYEKELSDKISKAAKSKENIEPDYSKDEAWVLLSDKITAMTNQISDEGSLENQMQTIDGQISSTMEAIAYLDRVLASADRKKLDEDRIAELSNKERMLTDEINKIEAELQQIADYKMRESTLIETAVNKMFKYVKFKLFDYQLNGSITEDCVATLNGVPYPDMSYGQKMRVDVDIVNVLSASMQLSVPLFIDNAESLTYPVEADTQVVRLIAKDGVKEIRLKLLDGKEDLPELDKSKTKTKSRKAV